MAILWKPTGSLDINTAPTDLPEQADGKNISSGALARCRNLILDRTGIARTRYGTSSIVATGALLAPELILEVGGSRYIFAGDQIFYDESLLAEGVGMPAPTFLPVAGAYTETQSVTISCSSPSAKIYFTVDGSTPDVQSSLYTLPVSIPTTTTLKAIAVDPRGFLLNSDVTIGVYGVFSQNQFITETDGDSLITETDSNNITTEGP
jgi:hypothetical protein